MLFTFKNHDNSHVKSLCPCRIQSRTNLERDESLGGKFSVKHQRMKKTGLENTWYLPSHSFGVIDKISQFLSRHIGFEAEEN